MRAWTSADIPDQTGRVAVVTGANGGLGLRTAEALGAAGARVVMACRNQTKAARAVERVAAVSAVPPTVVDLDLADLASVRDCAARIDESVGRVDVLVNNAGVMAIPRATTADGFEMQFGTNHLGHFALTHALLGALHRASAPRVVTVASIAHWAGRIRWSDVNWERRYFRWPAYSQAKLANLLFTAELDRRSRAADSPLVAVAAHPGIAATDLYDGPQAGRNPIAALTGRVGRALGQPDALGVLPQLRAATDTAVTGGSYLGAAGPLPGPFEIRGHPEPAWRSPLARSERAAGRLWDLSESLTGIELTIPT